MRNCRFFLVLILSVWTVGILCLSGFAADTGHEHTPDQLWWVDDEDQHWQTCLECGEKVLAGDHQWTMRVVEEPGSCVTERVEVLVCEVCQRIIRQVTPAAGHLWDKGVEVKKAACTEAGLLQFTCTACRETKTEEIPAIGHQPGKTWDSSSTQHWHICLACGGKTDISYHTWTNWITGENSTQSRSCLVCGQMGSRKNAGVVASDLVVVSGTGIIQKSFVRDGQGFAVCESTEGLTVESRSCNFNDVRPGAWYYDVVRFAAGHGLLVGTAPAAFSPNQNMTRAMLATVIYRMEGSPASGSGKFSDVPAGTWYTDAVNWAAAHGIIYGIGGGKYAPNAPVAREQMVTILYRYAQYLGMRTTARTSIQSFSDSAAVSDYAVTPMEWSVAAGLIMGRENGAIAPKATATRAEVAAVLQRMTVRLTEELGTSIS